MAASRVPLTGAPCEDDDVFRDIDGQPRRIRKFGDRRAGEVLSRNGPSPYQEWQSACQENAYHPFQSEVDFHIGSWLKLENISQAAIDRLLTPQVQPYISGVDSLSNVSVQFVKLLNLSFKSSRALNTIIDCKLPSDGLPWTRTEFSLEGTAEKCIFWHRDLLQAIRALYGEPRFASVLKYSPEQHFCDDEGENRIFDEMWTGNWWWRIQVRPPPSALPEGATVVPLIFGSDKTLLTQMSGDRYGYPIYLTIGNIPKAIRRSPTQRAMLLVGYLPTNKLEHLGLKEDDARAARQRIIHQCLSHLLEPTITPGKKGIPLVSGDGCVRMCHPLLGAWMADYPEQCLLTCTRSLRCPICNIDWRQIGNELNGDESLCEDVYRHPCALRSYNVLMKALSMTAVREPFWSKLHLAQIHTSMYPDILHQLLQGVLKHILDWLGDIVGDAELDRGFQTIPPTHGVRQFPEGLKNLQQLMGQERKAIARVLLGVIAACPKLKKAGEAGQRVIKATKAMLDFMQLASMEKHSERTVLLLRKCLLEFHANKHGFVELGARKTQERDNWICIPKFHSLVHYMWAVYEGGSLDNWTTSITERLHIDFAKLPFRHTSGKKDSTTKEMAMWVLRRERLLDFQSFV
ncbi:hypothetical protein CALCODRAFT_442895, partial [Calocera cornea HHB12733]